jgi:hypothetical protein
LLGNSSTFSPGNKYTRNSRRTVGLFYAVFAEAKPEFVVKGTNERGLNLEMLKFMTVQVNKLPL